MKPYSRQGRARAIARLRVWRECMDMKRSTTAPAIRLVPPVAEPPPANLDDTDRAAAWAREHGLEAWATDGYAEMVRAFAERAHTPDSAPRFAPLVRHQVHVLVHQISIAAVTHSKGLKLEHLGVPLPPQIALLTQLEALTLRDMPIGNLPAWLGRLVHLQRLDLRQSSVGVFPARAMRQLRALTQIYLADAFDAGGENRLVALPRGIDAAPNLQLIHLGKLDLPRPASLRASVLLQRLQGLENHRL